jgi:RNA polymerase sigma-70 factor (ECF subfamily)
MTRETSSRPPAFEEVAAAVSAPLQRYLARFVGDSHVAEDLLQETLLRIDRGLPGFEGRSAVKTWAFRIATRVAIDHLRRSCARERIVEMEDAGTLSEEPPESGERLVLEEMNACVREEIDRLPPDYRAAVLLHDLEGLTAAQTASALGCSLATAKIRIHRARARLSKQLERDCDLYHGPNDALRCDRKPSVDGD